MALKLIIKKLYFGKKFVTRDEIRSYCKELNLDYYVTIRYLTHHKYLLRILKGIFYVKSIEERKLNKIEINHLEAIKEALRIKGVKNWYFGLETALKLNNVTHEFFTIDYVINDKIFRAKPIMIFGHKVKFVKIKSSLFSFGINDNLCDNEKLLLDLIYLKRYNSSDIEDIPPELIKGCSKKRLIEYSKYYNKSVRKIVGEIK